MYYKRSWTPNMLTFGNLLLGFIAILMFSQGRYLTGSWLIVIAAILDGMDGAVARWVKSSSKFGGEVDSLADVVSFGVAPATLVYHVLHEPLGGYAIWLASLPMLAAAARLARYNVLSEEHGHSRIFTGMPTPTAALLFAGFYIYSHAEAFQIATVPIWMTLAVLVAGLMVSPFPYRRLPVVQIHDAKRPWLSVSVLVAVSAALLADIQHMLFALLVLYLFIGPVEWMLTHTGLGERIQHIRVVPVEGAPKKRQGNK